MAKLLVVGTIPAGTPALHLIINSAETTIVHEDRADIEVRANNPDNWQIADGDIEQIHQDDGLTISITGGGGGLLGGNNVDLSSIELGAEGASISIDDRTIVVQGTTLFVDGKKQKDAENQPAAPGLFASLKNLVSSSNSVTINGMHIDLRDDGVYANGKLQEDAPVEATVEGDSKPAEVRRSGNGADELVIAVPTGYRGGMIVENASLSDMSIDGWSGGNLHIETNGGAALAVNGPITDVEGVSLTLAGLGNADFNAPVNCGTFVGNLSSGGHLTMEHLDTHKLMLATTDMGDITIKSGSCNCGQVTSTEMGNVKLRGDFEELDVVEEGMGDIEIGEDVDIDD